MWVIFFYLFLFFTFIYPGSPIEARRPLFQGRRGQIDNILSHSLTVYISVSLPFPDSSSPLVIKKPPSSQLSQSEDSPWIVKRPAEDTVSTVSSLHSSPTVSPQGSPRKGLHPGYLTLPLTTASSTIHSSISQLIPITQNQAYPFFIKGLYLTASTLYISAPQPSISRPQYTHTHLAVVLFPHLIYPYSNFVWS